MNRPGIATALTLSVMILGGTIIGCGDADPASESEGTPAATQPAGEGSRENGSAPASAYGKSGKDAPDDVISDRPGGPNDKSNDNSRDKQSKGGKGTAGSGGVGPPVSLSPSK